MKTRSESKIIIINGPAGVGKTTVSRELAKLDSNSAVVEGDALKKFIINRDLNVVEGGLGYLNGANVTSNFINAGYKLVVFEYVFEKSKHIQKFIANVKTKCPIFLFTLWADIEIVKFREQNRINREPLNSRTTECWIEMQKNLSDLGMIINTKNQNAVEIAQEILLLIQNNKGRLPEIIGKADEN